MRRLRGPAASPASARSLRLVGESAAPIPGLRRATYWEVSTEPMRTSPRSPAPEPADASTPLPGPEVMALLPVSPETRAALRVLIVDDERTLRESCASVLTLAGYNITVCGRGQEALELLKRTRFDAVLLDLYMSQVPGMELLRACLEANRDTIVIVMTGNPSVASSIEALRAGAWDYLPKPFSATHLHILVGRAAHAVMVGHVKGAFAGAVRDKPGLLETANGGTLFLDELTEMSKPIQAKLLRVIQDGVVRRVGSETTDAVVNVRFIACTNGNPEEAVRAGMLREDLYYRLRVVPIHVPPLRERTEDIPLLANHFLAYYWRRHRDASAPLPRLSEAAVRALRVRPWRGNVRELQNVIEHTVVLIEPGGEIQPKDIPVIGEDQPVSDMASPGPISGDGGVEGSFRAMRDSLLARFERQYLQQIVTLAGGNMSRAARIAGVGRTTLYRLMERHGLQKKLLASTAEEE